jgi:hypothetical protein
MSTNRDPSPTHLSSRAEILSWCREARRIAGGLRNGRDMVVRCKKISKSVFVCIFYKGKAYWVGLGVASFEIVLVKSSLGVQWHLS